MTRAVSRTTIFNAVKKGIKLALRDYYKMSGENHFNAIPESYFQAKIADSISNMEGNFYTTLEDTYRRILKDAGAHGKAISYLKNPQERADIVIWWASGAPRIIIEVKRANDSAGLIKDAKKIRTALKHQSKLQGGIIVGTFRNLKIDTIPNKVSELAIRKGIVASRHDYVNLRHGKNATGKTVYAGAGLFLIE